MEFAISEFHIHKDITKAINLEGGYLHFSLGCVGRWIWEEMENGHLFVFQL